MAQTIITAVGKYLPERVVPNAEIAPCLGVTDEWIIQRAGVRERRFAESGVGSARLGANAAKEALAQAKRSPDDIDCIICATLTPDRTFPGNGMFIQSYLEMHNHCPVYDIGIQCSGFIYALSMAHAFIQSGMYQRILVIGCEQHSSMMEMQPRSRDVSVLFGDGAGAVIVEAGNDASRGIVAVETHAEGRYADCLWIPDGMCVNAPRMTQAMFDEGTWFPKMKGATVQKHAIKRMPEVVRSVVHQAGIRLDDVKLLICHQANLRLVELIGGTLGVGPERMLNNIDRYGNTTSASIPICLAEAVETNRIAARDYVVLVGFGSGFAWGAVLLRW